MNQEKFEQWAIVELFGHQRIAGLMTEQTIGGCQFVRVDVPAVTGAAAYTKCYGQGAIYAISFVDRDVALAAAENLRVRPVVPYDLAAVTKDAMQQRLSHAGFTDEGGIDGP